jgi:hypothetical protein
MPPPGNSTGVSGGAGDPLEALTVDVDAVDAKRFIGFGAMSAAGILVESILLLCC